MRKSLAWFCVLLGAAWWAHHAQGDEKPGTRIMKIATTDERARPRIDQDVPEVVQTATFALG